MALPPNSGYQSWSLQHCRQCFFELGREVWLPSLDLGLRSKKEQES